MWARVDSAAKICPWAMAVPPVSKTAENLDATVALHHDFYNFARTHESRTSRYPRTPAMAAGMSDCVWSAEEIVGLLD
jgi:hypothetical protein